MNHAQLNAVGTPKRTETTVHDAAEWKDLVEKGSQLKNTLDRWQSKQDLHPTTQKPTTRKDRKIAGQAATSKTSKASKPTTVGNVDLKEHVVVTPMPTDRLPRTKENAQTEKRSSHHFVSKPSISPKRMQNMTLLNVPSLNIAKQKSLRQPPGDDKEVSTVTRTKSAQAVSPTPSTKSLRRVVAKRGISVRRLPSYDASSAVVKADATGPLKAASTHVHPKKDEEDDETRSSATTQVLGKYPVASTHSRPKPPLPSSSFASITTSVTGSNLGSLNDEEELEKDTTKLPIPGQITLGGTAPIKSRRKAPPRASSSFASVASSVGSSNLGTVNETCPEASEKDLSSSPIAEKAEVSQQAPQQAGTLDGGMKSHSTQEAADTIQAWTSSPTPTRDITLSIPELCTPKRRPSISPCHQDNHKMNNTMKEALKNMECMSPKLHAVSHHGRVELHRMSGERNDMSPGVLRSKSEQVVSSNLEATSTRSRKLAAKRGLSVRHISKTRNALTPASVGESLKAGTKVSAPTDSKMGSFVAGTPARPSLGDVPPERSNTRSPNHGAETRVARSLSRKHSSRSPIRNRSSRSPIRNRISPHASTTRSLSPAPSAATSPMRRRPKSPPRDVPPALLTKPLPAAKQMPRASSGDTQKAEQLPQAQEGSERPSLVHTRSTNSLRSLLRRSISKSGDPRSPSVSKSPIRMRPGLNQRLMSLRSVVSINTNVAVSDETYPKKPKRQSSGTQVPPRRESFTEYGAKAVERKSLLARLGSSFRLAAAAVADDDVTCQSEDDDTSFTQNMDRKPAAKTRLSRQTTESSNRTAPDSAVILQKQQERSTLLRRLSRVNNNDEKTEATSVSKPQQKQDPADVYVPPRSNTPVPSVVHCRFMTDDCLEDDDASAITEAFTICESDADLNDADLEMVETNSRKSDKPSEVAISTTGSNNSAVESILGYMEQEDETEMDKDALVENLLNESPVPTIRIPRLKSLRTQSVRTKTMWKMEESDGSLYVDNPEHNNNAEEEEDETSYLSSVLNKLERVRSVDTDDENKSKTGKNGKKQPRDQVERVLIEL